jgi:anti-sigma regulatory factor (Ser/Thr protein kinase)
VTISARRPKAAGRVSAASYHLPGSLRSPGAARTLVQEALAAKAGVSGSGASADMVATAQVLVSELVTNAVLHADTPVVLHLRIDGKRVRIAVEDGSPAQPVRQSPSEDVSCGRGLQLLDVLSSAWGWHYTGGGKTIWFEL